MTTEPTPVLPAPETKTDPAPTPDPDRLPDDHPVVKALAKANAEAAEARLKLKDLEPLAAKAKELEDAQKTSEQKLTEALEQARNDASASRSELLRLQVALDKGLDAELVDFLPSGSKEEVEAAAEKLLTKLGDPKRRVPRPTPSQGVSQGDPTLTPGDEFASWLREKI